MIQPEHNCPKCGQPAGNAAPVITPILGKGVVRLLGMPRRQEYKPTITHEGNRLHGWRCPCGHYYPS